jgi:branched-chain amino acid transport system substrate-binding protein
MSAARVRRGGRALVNDRRAQAGVLAVAAALVLAACGSGSTSGAGSDSGSGGSGNDIVIGYAASQSGPQASNGLAGADAALAWEKATNAAGGIDGHPVKIEVTDTKNTTTGASAAVKGFEQDGGVDAIMLTDLVAEGPLVPLLKDKGIAVLSGGGSSDDTWYNVPGTFQDVTGSLYTIKGYAQAAKEGGATTFGWAACAELAICTAHTDRANAYAASIGMKKGGGQTLSASSTDYTAQCLAFQSKGVDGIALNVGIDTGVRFMSDCLQQGYKGTFSVMNSAFDQAKVDKVAGAKVVGSTQGFPWWADDPQVKAYRDAMAKYRPKGVWQSGQSTSVWTTLELFKKALENAKPAKIDKSTVLDAMYTIKNETLGGLLPQPITYTKGKGSPQVDCSWFFTYTAGDKDPAALAPTGTSGNGASGDLASTCVPYVEGPDAG